VRRVRENRLQCAVNHSRDARSCVPDGLRNAAWDAARSIERTTRTNGEQAVMRPRPVVSRRRSTQDARHARSRRDPVDRWRACGRRLIRGHAYAVSVSNIRSEEASSDSPFPARRSRDNVERPGWRHGPCRSWKTAELRRVLVTVVSIDDLVWLSDYVGRHHAGGLQNATPS